MARRKSSEVIISGDKADTRPRAQMNSPVAGTKLKNPSAAFPDDHLERRPRKKPKVIDAGGAKPKASSAVSDLAALERELGMTPTVPTVLKAQTEPTGAIAEAAMSIPIESKKAKKAANWEDIERAKKQEQDANWEDIARAKKQEKDANWEDIERAKKQEKDANWEDIERAKKQEQDADWDAIQRAKKTDQDLPLQPDPASKGKSTDDMALSQPVAPKPVADIAPPTKPGAASEKALSASKTVRDNKGKPQTTSTQLQHTQVAETIVSSILDRINEEARKNGGQLNLHHIESLRSEFETQTQALSKAFEQSFETYISARERAAWSNKRDFPFDRLIVKSFSHLFADNKAGFDRVSRRMLPGFFMAMGMMLGPDIVDEAQERCRVLVERIRAEKAEAFDWSDVYESEEKNDVIMDALVPIAVHFEDLEKRREWFISLINGHLSPLINGEKEDAGWEMTIPGFANFMNALLSRLRADLGSKTRKPRIVKRYGAIQTKTALRVLNRLR